MNWIGNLKVSDFKINDFDVGDVSTSIEHDQENSLKLHSSIIINKQKVLDANGTYDYSENGNGLDLIAKFDHLNIGIIEPFLEEYISEVKGEIVGNAMLKGSISKPDIQGDGEIKNAGLKVNYLNTKYTFEGALNFNNEAFETKDLLIKDIFDNQAEIKGGLYHDQFKNFIVDLSGDFSNFMLLNTTDKDNSLYYGEGFGTGKIDILGSFDNLNITVKAKTDKGTKFYLPFGGTEEINHADFITFKAPKKDNIKIKKSKKVKLKQLNFELDLEVTEDAYSEIIFDIKAGDIIKGRAKGNLKMNINPKGSFELFGDLDVIKGSYTFTMKNIFSKEFTVLPNSSIKWYGDPYKGYLDLKAKYSQSASLAPLFDSTRVNQNQDLRRKYTSDVQLNLKGPLLKPAIDFNLDFSQYPYTVSNAIAEIQTKLDADEQELNRQVFSLIFLGGYSPIGSFDINGNEAFGSSVSEYLSNQLSYWVTQVDENLEIDIDLGSFNENAFNNFQLRLSYTFLDGRLRVTRDGGFTDGNNNTNLSSIAGDWSVEYLLTPDGRLKVKMYNRNNYNQLTTTLDNAISTGFSISYTKNFDEIREIWQSLRKDKINKKMYKKAKSS